MQEFDFVFDEEKLIFNLFYVKSGFIFKKPKVLINDSHIPNFLLCNAVVDFFKRNNSFYVNIGRRDKAVLVDEKEYLFKNLYWLYNSGFLKLKFMYVDTDVLWCYRLDSVDFAKYDEFYSKYKYRWFYRFLSLFNFIRGFGFF